MSWLNFSITNTSTIEYKISNTINFNRFSTELLENLTLLTAGVHKKITHT